MKTSEANYDTTILRPVLDGAAAQLWIDRETGNMAILAGPQDLETVLRRRESGAWRSGGYMLVEVRNKRVVRALRRTNEATR